MPIIPKLNPTGPIANAPAPVLDRERRPTVNLSGVIDAVGDLGRASQMPLDNNDYTEPLKALGAAGEAVMRVGSIMGAAAMKRQEATDRRLINQAQMAMEDEANNYRVWQAQNANNPEAWAGEAQRRAAGFMKPFMEMKELSDSAKEDLKLMGQSWQNRLVSGAELNATLKGNALARDSYVDRAKRLFDAGNLDEGNAVLDEAASGGYLHASERDSLKEGGRLVIQARESDAAKSRYQMAILAGDDDGIEAALTWGKEKAKWTDDDVALLRLKGKQDAAQVREVAKNRQERDILGELAYELADTGTLDPAKVRGLVAAGQLDKGAAAQYLDSAKAASHALPGEWSKFLDTVATYDPDEDPKAEKAAALMREAHKLNPDRAGWTQFNTLFEKAQSENSDKGKLRETSALVAARNQVRELFAKPGMRSAWNEDLKGALQDTAKMEAYGIPAEQAAKIRALVKGGEKDASGKPIPQDFAAAFREFKTAAATANDKETAMKAGMSEWAFNLFANSAQADADAKIQATGEDRVNAAFSEAAMMDKLNAWFQSETVKNKGTPPDDMSVKKKLGELTTGYLQGGTAKAIIPKAKGSGANISFRGFEPAPNLADRLPEGLKPYANDFIEAGRKHGLDPYALAAISMHETAGGTSKAFREKNNAMGISDDSGVKTIASVRDSIFQQAASLARPGGYYDGKSTIADIAGVYAPVGASNDPKKLNGYWASGVSAFYQSLRD